MGQQYGYEEILECVGAVQARDPRVPAIAVVLGSGLGAFADTLLAATAIPYDELPYFPTPGVSGHDGKLVIGEIDGADGARRTVVAMQGRVHFYEGLTQQEVVFPVRVMRKLGAEVFVVTNAAGGLRADMVPGDLMMITDQINLTGDNPLRGPADERIGPRFPDMSAPFAPDLAAVIERAAAALDIPLRRGIYVGVRGPSYETAAEVRMLANLGGDAVGMSTVPEVLAAVHAGFKVCGVSCITNLGTGLAGHPLTHDEVERTARAVRESFTGLLGRVLATLPLRS